VNLGVHIYFKVGYVIYEDNLLGFSHAARVWAIMLLVDLPLMDMGTAVGMVAILSAVGSGGGGRAIKHDGE
jgi:hypothetical protein